MTFDELREWLSTNSFKYTSRWWSGNDRKEVHGALLKWTAYLPVNTRLATRIRIILDGYTEPNKCHCGVATQWYVDSFRTYCSSRCRDSDPLIVEKRKITTLERYGVVGVSTLSDFKEKKTKTIMARYGSTDVFYAQAAEKRKITNNKIYGTDHSFQSDVVKKKIKDTLNNRYGGHHLATTEGIEKLKSTNISRYGVEFPTQNPDVMLKIEQTNLARHGVKCGLLTETAKNGYARFCQQHGADHHSQVKEVKRRTKDTLEQRYGGHHLRLPDILEKQKSTNRLRYGKDSVSQVDEFKERSRQTSRERYGVDIPSQSPEVKSRTRATILSRWGDGGPMGDKRIRQKIIDHNRTQHGVDWFVESEVFKEKSAQTNLEHYGVEYASQSPEIRQRIRDTNLSRYGVGHPTQSTLGYLICNDDEVFTSLFKEHGLDWLISETGYHKDKLIGRAIRLGLRKKFTSHGELQLREFTQQWFPQAMPSRSIIPPLEIDIWIPEINMGIEYCGNWWHSDAFKNKNYHAEKLNRVTAMGGRLITIFESEWLHRRAQVEDRLKSIFGRDDKIGARKTKAILLDREVAREFMEKQHIQGSPKIFTVAYGLTAGENIVACMAFTRRSHEWELVRFCSNGTVVGGASKLLAKFEKDNQGMIFSFADLRWSMGELYRTLGFELDTILSPDYSYTKGDRIEHKFNHRKKFYADRYDVANLTEREIMQNEGWRRIWDCGKMRFRKG